MKYPEIGDMVTVVLEDATAERGIVEEWGTEWIQIREPNSDSISCIKEKYIVGFKILRSYIADEDKPVRIKGVQADQLNYRAEPLKNPTKIEDQIEIEEQIKSQALRMADAHLDRIDNERKKVKTHLSKTEPIKKYPVSYGSPSFTESLKKYPVRNSPSFLKLKK